MIMIMLLTLLHSKDYAISEAVVAIVRALPDPKRKELSETPQSSSGLVGPGVSPSKAIDLRMKNSNRCDILNI